MAQQCDNFHLLKIECCLRKKSSRDDFRKYLEDGGNHDRVNLVKVYEDLINPSDAKTIHEELLSNHPSLLKLLQEIKATASEALVKERVEELRKLIEELLRTDFEAYRENQRSKMSAV